MSGKALAAGFSADLKPMAGAIPLSDSLADPDAACKATGTARRSVSTSDGKSYNDARRAQRAELTSLSIISRDWGRIG